MSKKILALSLALMLIAGVFVGCSKENAPVDEGSKPVEEKPADTNNEVVAGDLVDGLYLIKGEVSENGNFPMTVLTVKDGQVDSLEYREYLINSGETKSNDNYPYAEGIAVVADLNSQFNDKKDLSAVDFDAVSGATHTKEAFKGMVGEILAKAANGETYEPVYKDGVYEAKAAEDSHGWLAQVMVKVEDGQIVGLDYAELAIEAMDGVEVGDRKSADNYPYPRPIELAKEVQKLVIDNNGTEDLSVDGISGATDTRDGMIELINEALSSAK